MISGSGIQAVQGVFLLLLVFVAMFAGLARRLKMPYPILLVIAGLLVARPTLALRLLRMLPAGAVARTLALRAFTALRAKHE